MVLLLLYYFFDETGGVSPYWILLNFDFDLQRGQSSTKEA
jgi:hypothetical protein